MVGCAQKVRILPPVPFSCLKSYILTNPSQTNQVSITHIKFSLKLGLFIITSPFLLIRKQTHSKMPSETDHFPYPDPEDIDDSPEFTKKIAVLRKYVEETRKQELLKSYGKTNSTTSSKQRRSISSDMGSQTTLHHSSSTTALRRNDSECAPKGNRDNGINVKKRTSLPCALTSVEFPLLQGATKSRDPGQTSTGKEDKPKGPFLQARKQQHRVKSAGIVELKKKSKLEISAQSKHLSPHQKPIKHKTKKETEGSRPLSAIT